MKNPCGNSTNFSSSDGNTTAPNYFSFPTGRPSIRYARKKRNPGSWVGRYGETYTFCPTKITKKKATIRIPKPNIRRLSSTSSRTVSRMRFPDTRDCPFGFRKAFRSICRDKTRENHVRLRFRAFSNTTKTADRACMPNRASLSNSS